MKTYKVQRFFLYIFFFSLNFEMFDLSGSGIFSIGKLTGILYFVSVIPSLRSFLSHSDIGKELRFLWIFFILLTIVSLFNINSRDSVFFNFSIFQNILLLIILINHERREPGILGKAFFVYSIGTIFLALLAIQGIGISYSTDQRMTIFNDNQNVIGMRMSIAMIIISVIVSGNMFKRSYSNFLLLIPFGILFTVMLGTGSRVAIISLSIALILEIFLLIRKSNIFKKSLIIIIGVLALYVLVDLVKDNEMMMSRLEKADEGDLSDRNLIWEKILPMIEERPVLGHGSTGYTEKIAPYYYGDFASPHNVLLEVFVYTGIVGLIFFLIYLMYLFIIAYKYYKKRNKLLALLLLIPIIGLILSGQILNVKIIYIIFAYVISRKFYLLNSEKYV